MPCLQASPASTATLSSDKRKVSTAAEIKAHSGELLVAAQVSTIATVAGIPLRHFTQLPTDTPLALWKGTKQLPFCPPELTSRPA